MTTAVAAGADRQRAGRPRVRAVTAILGALALLAASCGALPWAAPQVPSADPQVAWLAMPLADVRTGERFTLGQFAGRVVLVQIMAPW